MRAAVGLIVSFGLVTQAYAEQAKSQQPQTEALAVDQTCAAIASRLVPPGRASVSLNGYRTNAADSSVVRCRYTVTLQDGTQREVLGPPMRVAK